MATHYRHCQECGHAFPLLYNDTTTKYLCGKCSKATIVRPVDVGDTWRLKEHFEEQSTALGYVRKEGWTRAFIKLCDRYLMHAADSPPTVLDESDEEEQQPPPTMTRLLDGWSDEDDLK